MNTPARLSPTGAPCVGVYQVALLCVGRGMTDIPAKGCNTATNHGIER